MSKNIPQLFIMLSSMLQKNIDEWKHIKVEEENIENRLKEILEDKRVLVKTKMLWQTVRNQVIDFAKSMNITIDPDNMECGLSLANEHNVSIDINEAMNLLNSARSSSEEPIEQSMQVVYSNVSNL